MRASLLCVICLGVQGMVCGKFVLLCVFFSLLLRKALIQYDGGVRYGARFTPLVNGVVLQKGKGEKAEI